jgi:hypothetical protein
MWKPFCARATISFITWAFAGAVSRSVLADANRERDWSIYHDLAQLLIRRARVVYAQEPIGLELKETVYALDSTTIGLCLSLFR